MDQLLVEGDVLDHEVSAGREDGTQRSPEGQKQGYNHAIVHDGEPRRPGPLPSHHHRRETEVADSVLAKHRHTIHERTPEKAPSCYA